MALTGSFRGYGSFLLRHAAASIRATFARIGASLAMVHGVFGTFRSAGIARICTKCAHSGHLCTARSNGRCGEAADFGALQVQGDAVGHWLGALFFQARCRALKAGASAFVACAQTFNFFGGEHVVLLNPLVDRLFIDALTVHADGAPAHAVSTENAMASRSRQYGTAIWARPKSSALCAFAYTAKCVCAT